MGRATKTSVEGKVGDKCSDFHLCFVIYFSTFQWEIKSFFHFFSTVDSQVFSPTQQKVVNKLLDRGKADDLIVN